MEADTTASAISLRICLIGIYLLINAAKSTQPEARYLKMVSVGGYAACRVQYSTSSRLLNANKTGVTRLSLWLPRTYASRKLASKTGFEPASGLRWRHLSWAGIRKKQFQSIRTSPEERHPSSNAVTRHGNRCHFIPDTGRELIHHFDKCHCSGPPDWSSVTNLFHVTACAGARSSRF